MGGGGSVWDGLRTLSPPSRETNHSTIVSLLFLVQNAPQSNPKILLYVGDVFYMLYVFFGGYAFVLYLLLCVFLFHVGCAPLSTSFPALRVVALGGPLDPYFRTRIFLKVLLLLFKAILQTVPYP